MDLQGSSQSESKKLEQIVSQFLLKSLHIVLDSRIPSLRPRNRSGELSSLFRIRKSDRWFNLIMGDQPGALENLNFWHRNVFDPMVIDIILVHNGSSNLSDASLCGSSTGRSAFETVIERWIVQYEHHRVVSPHTGERFPSYKRTYKKAIILLRSLYSQMRLLPAYKIFRQLSSSTQTYNFEIIYKVSSFSQPFSRADEEKMQEYNFVPVEASPGRLSISLTYHHKLSDFKLEPVSFPPRIITDYVGSPTTDPSRSFPSSEKGVSATSFPPRGVETKVSSPFQRPHSWTSGFNKTGPFVTLQHHGVSPPSHSMSPTSHDSSSPSDSFGNRFHGSRRPSHLKSTSYDGQLSPPFSPSISPSTPKYLSNLNLVQNRCMPETAPVSIPHPLPNRSRYHSPNLSDPNRSSLPPPSPRSTRHESSSQDSPFSIRSIRKSEGLRSGEQSSGLTNLSSGHRVTRDSREDSGRFSGLLSSSDSPRIGFSRSSSRLSLQEDLDDCDYSCPFIVDDVDMSGANASTRTRTSGFEVAEPPQQAGQMGGKSQDAAVGVLVHMLRTAPPLCQDSSCYSSRSLKADADGVATASGFFMARKASDALEELRGYKEMKDLLLSKSGSRIISKDET